jgi:hypothetical protein
LVNGSIACDTKSSLPLLKGLKHLSICWDDDVADVLPVIGQNLVSLEFWGATAEVWQVVYNFPNLQNLNMRISSVELGINPDILATLNGGLKKRLKRLASFRVDGSPVRLGTDWAGY